MPRVRPYHMAALGAALVGIGLAARLGFFSFESLVAVVVGFGLVAVAGLRMATPPPETDLTYPALFTVFAVLAAIVTFIPGGLDLTFVAISVAAVLAFHVLTFVPGGRRLRLPVTAGLLVGAHITVIHRVPFPPSQDVFRFLNFGVDALVRGVNPYDHPIAADGVTFRLTYPPGALLLLAPFRLLFGDVRWGYITSELVVVVALAALLTRRSASRDTRRWPLTRWEEALILLPLALPRVNQAWYIQSNPEWVLLALAVVALFMRASWVWAGIVLGLGMATKQYFVVFPVVFIARAFPRRALGLGLVVALGVCLPFIAWGPHDFVDKVLGNLGNVPDRDRLTAWAALYNLGLHPARWVATATFAIGTGATAALWWLTRGRPLNQALVACGVALAVFSLCASFSAYNYFAYALVFCTWGLLLPPDWGASRPQVKY